MIWLAKRVVVFCILVFFGFLAAAVLAALKAPSLVILLPIFAIPIVLTWPIANLWKSTPAIGPAPVSHVRSPVFMALLTVTAVLGLVLSVALLPVSVHAAIGIFFGTGIALERLLRASRTQDLR